LNQELVYDSILFCSAIEQEILGIDSRIKNKFALGVGNMEAIINLFLFLQNHSEIKEIVFIGSAGTYDTSLCSVFSIVRGKDYHYRELSTWKGESNSPKLMDTYVAEQENFIEDTIFTNWKLEKFSVNSPHSITLLSLSELPLWENAPTLENMEVFGIAKLAKTLGLGFSSILGITNEVGVNGSQDWLKNYKLVSKKLIDELNKTLF
jgi:nucleoside phosphorylase